MVRLSSTLRGLSEGPFGGGDPSQLSMAEWRQLRTFRSVRFVDFRGWGANPGAGARH